MELLIHGHGQLGYGRDILEDSVEAFFEGGAEVTGSGSGEMGWNLDVEVSRDMTDDELARFTGFLARMKVPSGTTIGCHFEDGEQRTLTVTETDA